MVLWRVAALYCMAALAAVCSAQDTAATIEEAGPPARRNPRDDELPPPTLRRPQRPPSSSGSWSSLLSGLLGSVTRTASVDNCPGRCVHSLASLMCDEVREDVQCPQANMRCCVERGGGMPPPPSKKKDDSEQLSKSDSAEDESEDEVSLNEDGEVQLGSQEVESEDSQPTEKKKKRRRKKPRSTTEDPTTTSTETTTTTTTTAETSTTSMLQKDEEYEGDYEYTSPGNTSDASRFLINNNNYTKQTFELVNHGHYNMASKLNFLFTCFLVYFIV